MGPELKVSVITSTYNSEKYIGETIEAVIAQTYGNWEMLITDDCSTDNTVAIVREYARKDDRVKLFRLDENSGGGVACNCSIEHATGRFIAICDADDTWTPDKLEVQVEFMLKNGIALSYGSYHVCDADGNITGIKICLPKVTYRKTFRDNYIGTLTGMYDTAVTGKVYMPALRKRQDWGLWIAVLRKCGYGLGIKQPIARYRVRKNSISRNKIQLISCQARLYQTMYNVPLSIGYVLFFLVNLPSNLLKKLRYSILQLIKTR